MKPTFSKRGRLEIIYEILSVCRKPAKKTSILYRCNLSYNQLQKYLEYLMTQDLLSSPQSEPLKFYIITDKGKEFLDEYKRLDIILEGEKNNSAGLLNNHSKYI